MTEENMEFNINPDDFEFEENDDINEIKDEKDFNEEHYDALLKQTAFSVTNLEQVEEKLNNIHQNYAKVKPTYEEVEDDFYNIIDEIVREKVKGISQIISDPIKRAREETKLEKFLRTFFSPKLIDELISEVMSADIQPIVMNNLQELFKLKEEHETFLVKNLFRYGSLILIAAYAKTGKSLFVTSLCTKVLMGYPFLGRDTNKGNILYLQNEEALVDTSSKIYNNGLQNLESKNQEQFNKLIRSPNFITAKHLDIIADLKAIQNLIQENNISLVVIDSLAASIGKTGVDEYSQKTMAGLYKLQEVMHVENCVGILTHHTNKSDSNQTHQDKLKGVAGFSGISRANDGIIKLSRHEKNNSHVLVDVLPRSARPSRLTIELFEEEADYWDFHVISDEELSVENISQQNDILRELIARYEIWREDRQQAIEAGQTEPLVYGYTCKYLQNCLNMSKNELVRMLNYMCRTDGIGRYYHPATGGYIYHYPKAGESWLDQYLEQEEELNKQQEELFKLLEIKKNQFLKCKNADEFHEIKQELSQEEFQSVFKKMTEDERQQMFRILFPPAFEVGERVQFVAGEDENAEELTARIISVTYPYKKNKQQKNVNKKTSHEYHLDREGFTDVTFKEFNLSRVEVTTDDENNDNNADELETE